MHRAHRRLLVPAAVAASIALAFTGCSASNFGGNDGGGDAAEEGPIKIGAVLDITGVGANLGVPEQNTLNMLAEQLNEDGGINGREVELIIKDNQSTEDGAARATTQLIENDDVDLIIGASRTGPSLAMRPLVEAAQLPTISVAANAAIVDGSEWVFKTAQNDLVVLEQIMDDAESKGYTKVALARDVSLPPGWMDHVVYAFVTPATLQQLGVAAGFDEIQFVVRDVSLDRDAVRHA